MMAIVTITIRMGGVSKTVVVQPGVGLGVSFSISLSSWFSLGGPLAVVAVWMSIISVSSVTKMMTVVTSITQMMAIVTVSIRMGGVTKTVVVQPGVGLGVSLSSGLGLGIPLLYGHDSLVLSLRNGGGHSMEGSECGKVPLSAGDEGTIVVPTAGWGRVDEGSVVVGEGKMGVRQGVAHMVGKPGLGLGLSSSI